MLGGIALVFQGGEALVGFGVLWVDFEDAAIETGLRFCAAES